MIAGTPPGVRSLRVSDGPKSTTLQLTINGGSVYKSAGHTGALLETSLLPYGSSIYYSEIDLYFSVWAVGAVKWQPQPEYPGARSRVP